MVDTLVFVPGLCCTGALFAPQISAMAEQPIMIAQTCSDDAMKDMAARLLKAAPERFALAGLSMGGYIALEVVKQAPERVAKLALLNTNARADSADQTQARKTQIRITEKGGYQKIAAMQFPQLVHPARLEDAPLRNTIVQMAEDVGPDAFIAQQTAIMGRRDQRPFLQYIQCPTLIVSGAQDALIAADRAQEMHSAIAGSIHHEVQDCGHMSTLEKPSKVTNLLQHWLTA